MSNREFLSGRVTLHAGDCREVLASLPEASVDSVVCDPPYHLTSIVKRFGKPGSAPVRVGDVNASNDLKAAFARQSAGFMGKAWDGGDIAFKMETWAEVLRVLKPGGYLLAFASTRGFGRMSVAIEDAGFITHPFVAWIFATGFPKATRVDAEGYEGFRYGGQALKPAIEPIYMGQKPFEKGLTGTQNILKWGTGALNIDGCRVGYGGKSMDQVRKEAGSPTIQGSRAEGVVLGEGSGLGSHRGKAMEFNPSGRWPANIVLEDHPEVLAAFPDAGGQLADISPNAPSPKTSNVYGKMRREGEASADRRYAENGSTNFAALPGMRRDDAGSAARFFACFPVENEARCDLCYMLLERENDTVKECNVTTAETPSQTPDILNAASVHADAAGSQVPENEGKRRQSKSRAPDAARHSRQCHQPSANTVQENAPTGQLSRTVQNVKSAASLCSSCATAIARALVGARPHQNGASPQFPASISGRNAQILSQHLALYVAGREGTDIILTTPSLKQLLGSVFHAIARSTPESAVEPKALSERSRRFWYGSKADQDDRLASRHPTVKPLDLMQWLVRLVTPKGGTVLDPFAGTGTTGEAAWREGMHAILIEREPEYLADIERRMELAANPTKRTAVAKTKNNLDDPNELPLFKTEAAE